MIAPLARTESTPAPQAVSGRRVAPVAAATAADRLPVRERRAAERRRQRVPVLLDTRGGDRRHRLRNVYA